MNLEDLEKRITENTEKFNKLAKEIENNLGRINANREKIEHNSGALALLHTIKSNGDKYFIIWLVTFVAFLCSIGYIVYLHTDIEKVSNTQEIEDVENLENSNFINGDNYGNS